MFMMIHEKPNVLMKTMYTLPQLLMYMAWEVEEKLNAPEFPKNLLVAPLLLEAVHVLEQPDIFFETSLEPSLTSGAALLRASL